MAERSIEEIAEDVLRLDQAATPGPWEAKDRGSMHDVRSPAGTTEKFEDGTHMAVAGVWGRGVAAHAADAALIATYRTAAPELAREVQRLQIRCRSLNELNAQASGLMTQAADLTRTLEAERDAARAALSAVAYRPGLPSMEQVRAHEARGGWWMGRIEKRPQRWPDALRFVNMIATGKIIQHSDGNDGHFFAGPTLTKPLGDWDDEAFLVRYAWRPCLPDGTPCPWLADG